MSTGMAMSQEVENIEKNNDTLKVVNDALRPFYKDTLRAKITDNEDNTKNGISVVDAANNLISDPQNIDKQNSFRNAIAFANKQLSSIENPQHLLVCTNFLKKLENNILNKIPNIG